jgi:iron(III) transport system substrate-binding protein
MLKGWVENLAGNVYSSDTLLLEAIAEGKCDVCLSNSFYYARILKEKPDLGVKIFWPKDSVHVNIMGAGVLTHSKNKAEAVKFLEWASAPKAQKLFASMNFEYPVNPKAEVDPLVSAWGTFQADKVPLFKLGEKQQAAVKLMDKVGYR